MATLKRSIINIALTLVSFAFSSWFYEHYLMTYTHYISSYGALIYPCLKYYYYTDFNLFHVHSNTLSLY